MRLPADSEAIWKEPRTTVPIIIMISALILAGPDIATGAVAKRPAKAAGQRAIRSDSPIAASPAPQRSRNGAVPGPASADLPKSTPIDRRTVSEDTLVFEQGLLILEAQLHQVVRYDNRVDRRPYLELARRAAVLEKFALELRDKSLSQESSQTLTLGLQSVRLYKHILNAYNHFFLLNFPEAMAVLEELQERTAGTLVAGLFRQLSQSLVYDLRRSAALPVYPNGDLLAVDRARVGDYLRLQHWSNCRFERNVRDFTFLRCLMGNSRDEVLIPVLTAEARGLFSQSGKPAIAVSSCRLHRLVKKSQAFEVHCQVPVTVPPATYKVLAAREPSFPRQTNQASAAGRQPAGSRQASAIGAPESGQRKAAATPQKPKRHQAIGGVVEVPRADRAAMARETARRQKAAEQDKNAAFDSDMEKDRFKYQAPPELKEY